MKSRRDNTNRLNVETGYTSRRAPLRWAAMAALVCALWAGPRFALADCCTCTSDYGSFCGPTDSVPCGVDYGSVNCAGAGSAVVVGGTCVGGVNGGAGLGGTCVPPAASPTPTATITPSPSPTPIPQGDPCTQDTDCATGYCVSGICCNTACPAPGQCTLPGQVGTCTINAPAPMLSPGFMLLLVGTLVLVGVVPMMRRWRA
jgi:hypothetical protein